MPRSCRRRASAVLPRRRRSRLAAGALLGLLLATGLSAARPAGAAPRGAAAPLVVSFDFTRAAIELDVVVNDTPLHVILDTGVDPSIVDLAVADRIGLKVDRGDAGEASGFGDGRGATVYPTRVPAVMLGGRRYGGFDALAADMTAISAGLGRRLDGVLGQSFLADKRVLIDYPARRLVLLDDPRGAAALVRPCRVRWQAPLRIVDGFPILPRFRFGGVAAPVSLDTGSTGFVGLFESGVALPGMAAALHPAGAVTRTGARGQARSAAYRFDAPLGFGPFALPPGVAMTRYAEQGSRTTRVANVGNRLFDAMRLRMLLDYPGRTMRFFGRCDG